MTGFDFKKYISHILLCLMVACLALFLYVGYSFVKGRNGYAEDAVLDSHVLYVGTPEELVRFSARVNGGEDFAGTKVLLTQDIDMSGIGGFAPIGIWRGEHYFDGIFDGQGHTITGLFIDYPEGNANNGLFGSLAGEVCNLRMEGCVVRGSACGIIASVEAPATRAHIYNCTIENCEVQADYTNILGGQYSGDYANVVIDGERLLEREEKDTRLGPSRGQEAELFLNARLMELSAKGGNVPMYPWKYEEGKLSFAEGGEAYLAPDMRLTLESRTFHETLLPYYKDGSFLFFLPYMPSGVQMLTMGEEVYPIDFQKMHPGDGNIQTFGDIEVEFCIAADTPALFLETESGDAISYMNTSKLALTKGSLMLLDGEGNLDTAVGVLSLGGRGNDSWLADKKGYNLTLNKKKSLLGMGLDTDYCLIPGFRDNSLLTYRVVHEVSRDAGFLYVPDSQFVSVYMDGNYQGVYLLTEKIKIGRGRVDLTETFGTDSGFIYELDDMDAAEEEFKFHTERDNTYVVKSPAYPTDEQLTYGEDLWERVEEALYSEDGYNASGEYYGDLIDLSSWARLYAMYDFMGEMSLSSSIYFYKDGLFSGDEKLYALYPWDVEHSLAAESRRDIDYIKDFIGDGTNGFWKALYAHADFREELFRQWDVTLKPLYKRYETRETLSPVVEQYQYADICNRRRWGNEQNMQNKADFIAQWVKIKVPMMDRQLGKE